MANSDDDRLKDLVDEFRKFRDQYELDMRGDKSLKADGSLGMVNELRKLKERLEKYPSLSWLFATRPFQTITYALMIYVFLNALYTLGLIRLFSSMFGIDIP